MATQQPLHAGVVLAGGPSDTTRPARAGRDGADQTIRPRRVDPTPVERGSAAGKLGGTAADLWPDWARTQLDAAVTVAAGVPRGGSVAAVLYRDWFNPPVPGVDLWRTRRPLAGMYRAAHAGSDRQVGGGRELPVVARHDVVGADGWWRTWGERWTPPRSRPGSVRLLMTPRAETVTELVTALTAILGATAEPWSLGCATSARRLRRYAPVILDLPALDTLPEGLLPELLAGAAPLLRDVTPPLCLPVAPGVALAHYPDNGMTFGEHRCHLVALGLRRLDGRSPAEAVGRVFAAHGISPAAPYRGAPAAG